LLHFRASPVYVVVADGTVCKRRSVHLFYVQIQFQCCFTIQFQYQTVASRLNTAAVRIIHNNSGVSLLSAGDGSSSQAFIPQHTLPDT
jgi:hypothetical protein